MYVIRNFLGKSKPSQALKGLDFFTFDSTAVQFMDDTTDRDSRWMRRTRLAFTRRASAMHHTVSHSCFHVHDVLDLEGPPLRGCQYRKLHGKQHEIFLKFFVKYIFLKYKKKYVQKKSKFLKYFCAHNIVLYNISKIFL